MRTGRWWLAISLGAGKARPGVRDERRVALAQMLIRSTPPSILRCRLRLRIGFARGARLGRARASCRRDMLTRNPADAEMAWQLSHAQWQCNDAAAAEATMRAANAASPGNADVLAAIGFYLCEQARYEESEAMLHQALAANPHAVTPAVDLADLELRRGSGQAAGSVSRHASRATTASRTTSFRSWRACPRRRGETLAGKTLVVHSELGNGDDIHMVRYVPQLAAPRARAEGGRLVLCVRKSLQPLLRPFLRGLCIDRGRPARRARLQPADDELAACAEFAATAGARRCLSSRRSGQGERLA